MSSIKKCDINVLIYLTEQIMKLEVSSNTKIFVFSSNQYEIKSVPILKMMLLNSAWWDVLKYIQDLLIVFKTNSLSSSCQG